jgi:hypothetical protein
MEFNKPMTASGYKPKGSLKGETIPEGYSKYKLQQFTPEQMQMLEQLIGHLGPEGWLSKLAMGDEGAFDEIEAPQKRQFSDTIAGIGSRYSGMGMGGQKSSGFQNEQTSAAQNFSQQLGSQRQKLKSDAFKDLMNFSNQALNQRPYDQGVSENPESFGEKFALMMMNAITKAASGGKA